MITEIKKHTIVILSLLIVFIGVNVIGTGTSRKVFIDGDGSGHYSYLPALLIYKTVDFTPVLDYEKSRRPPDYMGHYFHKYGDIYINKYTSGTALLQLPFFLLGYLISLIFGFSPDGYNIVFQFCIAISTVFYVSFGLVYLVKLMALWGINKRFGWLLAILGLFSTNLFFYTFIEPSFSHAYSFTVITAFLYFARRMFADYSRRYLVLTAFIYGLIILIRPANAISIFALPFISGNWYSFKSAIGNKVKNLDFIPAAVVFLVALSPQLIINYLQTGTPILYGYQDEGFYFNNPQILNFLFSYRKGWLVYTPVFLLIFPAIIYILRSQTLFASFGLLIFLISQVYIFSSWWNWYYGDSFGMRPMVDYYGLFILVTGLFIFNACKNWVKILSFIYIGACLILNLIQSYQYAKGIIHADSMSKEAYWYIFLDMDKDKAKTIAGCDESYYGELSHEPFLSTSNSIDSYDKGWLVRDKNETESYSGDFSVKLTNQNIYSPSFNYLIPDSLIGYNNIYVKFSTRYLEKESNNAGKSLFVIDIGDDAGNIFYKSFKVKKIPNNKVNLWQKSHIGFKLPEITPNMKYIKLYIWNIEKQTFYVDDMEIAFYTYNIPE